MDRMSVIYTTFETEADARRVGEDLVQSRVAACVNILPQMISIYRWENEFHNSHEVVLLAKTTSGKVAQAMQEIRRLHTADTPAIFEIPTGQVDNDFLQFVNRNTA